MQEQWKVLITSSQFSHSPWMYNKSFHTVLVYSSVQCICEQHCHLVVSSHTGGPVNMGHGRFGGKWSYLSGTWMWIHKTDRIKENNYSTIIGQMNYWHMDDDLTQLNVRAVITELLEPMVYFTLRTETNPPTVSSA